MNISAAVAVAACMHSSAPPPQYTHPPVPASRVYHMPGAVMQAFAPRGHILCGMYDADHNTIWVRADLPPSVRARVLAHEIAHANGWHHGGYN